VNAPAPVLAPPGLATPTLPFLRAERAALEARFPGLDAALAARSLSALEAKDSPALEALRAADGPGLLVPAALGGGGASLLEAVRLQRAIGSRAPSLAVAATMHHFSVSSLVDIARLRGGGGIESMLLGEIAQERLYLASAFAEGRTGSSIFSSRLRVERCLDGLRVNGSKKPCTLSRSFDLLTASLLVPGVSGEPDRFAVAVIPRATPGISVRPFWQSPILGATESDEVVLSDVLVPEMQVAYLGQPSELDCDTAAAAGGLAAGGGASDIQRSGTPSDPALAESRGPTSGIQLGGFLAFELLASASYLGIASGLVERALLQRRGAPSDRVALATELEGAAMALEGVARAADASRAEEESLVAQALLVRRHVQSAIERAGDLAVEVLGGMAFIGDPDVSYLLAATRALAFHPPSRRSAIAGLDAWLTGERLELS